MTAEPRADTCGSPVPGEPGAETAASHPGNRQPLSGSPDQAPGRGPGGPFPTERMFSQMDTHLCRKPNCAMAGELRQGPSSRSRHPGTCLSQVPAPSKLPSSIRFSRHNTHRAMEPPRIGSTSSRSCVSTLAPTLRTASTKSSSPGMYHSPSALTTRGCNPSRSATLLRIA